MSHFVYRLFGADDALIYVGCSKHPEARLRQHRSDHRWWYDLVASMTTEEFPDEASALVAERRAIETEHPSHNLAHRWEVRETWEPKHFVNYVRALRRSRSFDPFGHATDREKEARRLHLERFGTPLHIGRSVAA